MSTIANLAPRSRKFSDHRSETVAEIMKRLRTEPEINTLPAHKRHRLIQMHMMEMDGVDPDDRVTIAQVEDRLTRVLERLKNLTSLSNEAIGGLIGKSTPAVQAYISGRLQEKLSRGACLKLERIVEGKRSELDALLRDIRHVREHADA